MLAIIGCGIVALPLVYVAITYIIHLMNLKNYPDGLFPIPIVGNLHQLNDDVHLVFTKLSQTFGDVFSVSYGMQRVVIVNSYEAAIEALCEKSQAFAGREKEVSQLMSMITSGKATIGDTDYGKEWAFKRRLSQIYLRIGGGGINVDELIIRESDELEKRLVEMKENPVSVKEQFGVAVMNIISMIVFSERFEINDEDYKIGLKFGCGVFELAKKGDPTVFLPWLRFFPLQSVKLAQELTRLKKSFMSKRIRQHQATINTNKIRDMMDGFLAASQDKEDLKKHGFEDMGHDDIESVLAGMFIAGFETTLTTLGWAVLYLIHWPKCQEEIYQEMMKYVGPDRKPTLEDRSELHLMEATIQETLRLSSVAHSALPHKTTEETSIAGIPIPKDTTVLFNLWNIAHDERYWEKPNEFIPYRWLDEEGKYSPRKHKNSIPFSAGKRICFGEQLARKQLFLYLARILHQFEILPNPDEPFPSLDAECGLVLFHLPYTVIFKKRK